MFAECDGARNSAVTERRKRNLRRRKSDREIRDSSAMRMLEELGKDRYIKDFDEGEIYNDRFNNLIINYSKIN